MNPKAFRSKLLNWYDNNKRDLPWRDCNDPYAIWISEIMLQQTRVDQVVPYYDRFMERFPTVQALADADQQEVLKIWEGLGYYSRARNMHHASKTIVNQFGGTVPANWDDITELKGVGPYTASAVLSIAYGKDHAVVDGNVIRVLSRYFGIEDDVRATETKKQIQEAADKLIDSARPGDFNQALMELGATVCTPDNPACGQCPINSNCIAYKTLKTDDIPYKSPAKKRPHHHIGVGIIQKKSKVLIALRPEEAMLGGLWEFPGGKQQHNEDISETVVRELNEELGVEVSIKEPFMKLEHAYSHFTITLHAYICELIEGAPTPHSSQQVKWVPVDKLEQYPFPRANRKLTRKLMKLSSQKKLNF